VLLIHIMQRYLLFFSYKGTNFIGFQTQSPRAPSHTKSAWDFWIGRRTVQGAIEEAILKLRPRNDPILLGSSRTDAGVHALETSATVDLKRRVNNINESEYYRPKQITDALNDRFVTAQLPIR